MPLAPSSQGYAGHKTCRLNREQSSADYRAVLISDYLSFIDPKSILLS